MQVKSAPELPASLEWLNAPPTTLAAQRGRAVLLAFWNAGSAWSHNLIDELRLLQARHQDGLQILAIHVPKFDAERQSKLVRKMVNRLGITFPVAHDRDYTVWQHYGIRGWPTTVLIDRDGVLHDVIAGDTQPELLRAAVERVLEGVGSSGLRRLEPIVTRSNEPPMALAFPSGLAVTDSRLYIADSGHHRVLECDHGGHILREFGTGHPDLTDGNRDEAGFRYPRGLALLRDALFVADTGNHALRRIRLSTGEVETLAGNGRPGTPIAGIPDAPRAVALNQPWAVAAAHDRVYIALAGCNQIWAYDLGRGRLDCVAGSGELGLLDGVGERAGFAHPASLALVQQTLYVCDAAASALRSVQLGSATVSTLVGSGLFDYGDQDGQRADARLQAPQAIALDPGAPFLWVADSYNGSLRQLRLGGGELRRFELRERLQQPAALAVAGNALWIANTDAHEVLRVDIDSGQSCRVPIGD